MASQFDIYAKFYDLLYKDKNYTAEAVYIQSLIEKYSPKDKRELRLLDLACGTGRHLFELSDLGFAHLSGSDISSSMIAMANDNAASLKKNISFYNYSFQESNQILPARFDVILSMFSAVNYITSFEEQLKTFQNIYQLLFDRGIFIFDYWNGNAVVRDHSPVKVLKKKRGTEEIIRISTTKIDLISQQVEVLFNCLYFENERRTQEFEELHHLHYYFFSEIQNLLKMAGFTIIHQSPFQEAREISAYDWNISIVAQKNP